MMRSRSLIVCDYFIATQYIYDFMLLINNNFIRISRIFTAHYRKSTQFGTYPTKSGRAYFFRSTLKSGY